MLRIAIIAVQLFSVLITAQPEDFLADYINTLTLIRIKSSGFPDYSVGEKLEQWSLQRNESNANPDELGTYFEGDILHPPVTGANGLIDKRFRWVGAIPYQIGPGFTTQERQMIQRAINTYHQFTCIRFRPYKTGDIDYIRIEKTKTGCWSSVGRVGGMQKLNLQAECLFEIGVPIHELMHAIGFYHEQSRLDRDQFVDILWENIKEAEKHNFNKEKGTTPFGVAYDYPSVMHYSANAFTKNGKPTIRTKLKNVQIGQRKGLSVSDIKKIKSMYRC